MDLPGLLAEHAPGAPAGLGGCRNSGSPYPCCDHDVYIFDGAGPDNIAVHGKETATIHHCSIKEADSCSLARYVGLDIISDPEWELQTMLVNIGERKNAIYSDCMRNSLVNSLFCTARSKDGPGPFAACWVKCAAVYLADAIMLYHGIRPSPAHMLQDFHGIKGGRTGSLFSIVSECLGMERATPVLLNRMSKSAAGFSDLAEGNGRSSIILQRRGTSQRPRF
ncbi:hypothetical protein CENSYa_1142 [Cenarchaeum symbiosum A]|uniref:Uncharacterized protein n=1 Tax=Cenarchaeum symbiosum (strain A) TaxID=414004 RepID=A0RWQ2_CENSY|nr:hypothetical protein CENSYa_1142 [Cenarchaeum symbiosum A]